MLETLLVNFFKAFFLARRRLSLSRIDVNGYDLFDDPALPAAVADAAKGRFEPGRRLLAEAAADFELRAARLRKLTDAAVRHVSRLDALYRENPEDGDIALWLGATHIEHGWQVRGAAMAEYIDRRKFEEFWVILGRAHEPLTRAAALCPDDPVPWDRLQWYGLGAQRDRSELDDIWTELKRRGPDFYEGHASRVQVLCAKWQGSNEEVLEFAERAAAEAPLGNPIPALLVAAYIEIAFEHEVDVSTYFKKKAVRTRVAEYADAWCASADGSVRTAEAHHMFGAAFYLGGDSLSLDPPRNVC